MKRYIYLGLVLFACFSLSFQLTGCQSAASSPPAATGTPSAEEARRIIFHALQLLSTSPNRMSNTTVAADGTIHQNVIEFIPPDKKHISGEGTETLVAGGLVYFRDSTDGSWQMTEIPAITYLGIPLTTEKLFDAVVEGGEYVRADTLDGTPVGVFHYATISHSDEGSMQSQVELWVGQADGLPYKMVVNGGTLKVSMDPATGEKKTSVEEDITTSLIVFDKSIKIEAPTP